MLVTLYTRTKHKVKAKCDYNGNLRSKIDTERDIFEHYGTTSNVDRGIMGGRYV